VIALFVIAIVLFILGYRYYGAFLDRQFNIDPSHATPAHTSYDGLDYVPARTPVLMGHHFSSIAGAGPIVGPIFAVAIFGWLPAVLWIVLGSIFIGGVHDYSSLVISIRHKARSIAQVAKELMSPRAHKLYLVFIWFALVYVLTVFVDLTALTFKSDGGVATSSLLYIMLAVMLGVSLYRFKLSLPAASLVFVPLVFAAIYVGQLIPLGSPPAIAHGDPKTTWTVILLAYCFIASITPVWILLQPRDYLSSYLLFACIVGGIGGIFISHPPLDTRAFLGFHSESLGYLFPALFITIACGACSGFHSIVASGTTAKQLGNEKSARPVAYGSMLVEGLLALIAVAAIVAAGGHIPKGSAPPQVFASGMGKFLGAFGIPGKLGISFGLLALSTFLLTTLDTATRLARYIFEELFNMWGIRAHILATTATLVLPLWLALVQIKDPATGQVIPAWKAIWPVFGATNQLLGGLALLTVGVWLKRTGRRVLFATLPMAFMLAVTLFALVQLVIKHGVGVIGVIAALLFVLAVILIIEAVGAFSGDLIDESTTTQAAGGGDSGPPPRATK
jgi:carbon starvation protein